MKGKLYKYITIIPTKKRYEKTKDVWIDLWGHWIEKDKVKREKIGRFDLVNINILQPHKHLHEHIWITCGKHVKVWCPDRKLWIKWLGTHVEICTYPETYNMDQPDNKKLIDEYNRCME